jgi:hypothetical protein
MAVYSVITVFRRLRLQSHEFEGVWPYIEIKIRLSPFSKYRQVLEV